MPRKSQQTAELWYNWTSTVNQGLTTTTVGYPQSSNLRPWAISGENNEPPVSLHT